MEAIEFFVIVIVAILATDFLKCLFKDIGCRMVDSICEEKPTPTKPFKKF